MANRKHLINVHTSTGTQAPTGASLYLGEIAVQHTPNEPAIWIKMGSADTSTEYEKFIGETEILNLLEETKILGSGYTYSGLSYIDSSTTIADAFSALTNELIKDEKVTAAAINELNVKTNEINSVKQIIREDEEVTAGAINLLNERVSGVETHMTGDYIQITGYELASGSTEEELTLREEDTVDEAFGKLQKQMLDNEEAIAAGLNDLNNKVEDLEEQIEHSTGVTQLSGAVMTLCAVTVAGFEQMGQDMDEGLSEKVDWDTFDSTTGTLQTNIDAVSAKTSGILTLNLNGVEQGQYCPSASTEINLEAIQEITGADVLLTGYELASGSTEEELVVLASDTVNEAFGKLQKQNYDNEAVVAGALNDLDERVAALEEGGSVEPLSAATIALSAATVTLSSSTNADIQAISADTIELSAATVALSAASEDFFDDAEYISSAKTIVFKHGDVEKASIDATEFIKDGMVSAVTISGGSMIISFNTDAGREDIELELTDIFDPDNYYTKDDINDGVSASTLELSAATIEVESGLTILSGVVIDTSYVVAQSLNDLSSKENALSAGTVAAIADLEDKIDELSGNTSISELSAATIEVKNDLATLSGVTEEVADNLDTLSGVVIDTSYVVAQSLNDLNRKVDALSGNTGLSELSAATVDIKSGLEALSGEVISLSSVTETISGLVADNKDNIEELSAATIDIESGLETLSGVTEEVADGLETLSGVTEEISDNLETLSGVVIDNELVTAEALISLNNKIAELSGNTGISELSAATVSIKNDLETLSGATEEVADGLETLSGAVEDMSYVVAMSLNDLSSKENALSAGTVAAITDLGDKIDELSGNSGFDGFEEITWSALKTLRDSSGLTPGKQYRITDYNTTTSQENTQAAGHQFDIIVVADSVNKLNENARAIRHSGDTYFSGSTLEAWELKYDIDNDTTKFAWANTGATGRGVIYYMKDEWNNECPYDFKNIQFARWEQTTPVGYVFDEDEWDYVQDSDQSWVSGYNLKAGFYSLDGNSNDVMLFFNEDLEDYKKEISYTVSSTPTYCYTFGRGLDTSLGKKVYDNVIKEYYNSNKLQLNNIVFLQTALTHTCCSNTFGSNCCDNTFGNNCPSNTFGNNCYSNTFGNYCRSNTFGNDCYSNTFGNSCYSNTFGNNCYSNTFGNSCYSNTFGNDCGSNTFGNSCYSNTFGNYCESNTFGDGCNSNTFGNSCIANTFGNGCQSNTFKTGCYFNVFGNCCMTNSFSGDCNSNTFGNNCLSNTFGNSSYYNSFGNHCQQIIFNKDYVQNVIVENGNQYITLTSTQSPASSTPLRNITIAQGVNNSTTRKTISHNTLNDTFNTTYQSANSQIINI